jgi:hypothetical protein
MPTATLAIFLDQKFSYSFSFSGAADLFVSQSRKFTKFAL